MERLFGFSDSFSLLKRKSKKIGIKFGYDEEFLEVRGKFAAMIFMAFFHFSPRNI